MDHLPVNNEFDTALGRNNGFDRPKGRVKTIINRQMKIPGNRKERQIWISNEFDTAHGRNNAFDTAHGPVKTIISPDSSSQIPTILLAYNAALIS